MNSRPKIGKSDAEPKTRYEKLAEADPDRQLPEADLRIVEAWHSVGIYEQGAFGMLPISWSELEAFVNVSKVQLSSWEAEQIIKMSRAYVKQAEDAKQASCPIPWRPEMTKEQWAERGRRIAEAFDKRLVENGRRHSKNRFQGRSQRTDKSS